MGPVSVHAERAACQVSVTAHGSWVTRVAIGECMRQNKFDIHNRNVATAL